MGLVSVYMGVFLFFGSMVLVAVGFKLSVLVKSLFIEWSLFSLSGGISLELIILVDLVMVMFIGLVLFISSVVLVYSSSYMELDPFFYRFIILVNLFVASMVLMVASPNLVSILLGWDGLGLVSYCLIIFYQNDKSASSGMLTVLSNRVGDVAILLSISWMASFGSWNFVSVVLMYSDSEAMVFITFLIGLAALTKSAQIPFSAWLPAAMAAPTPVSALVHSSTLVTAGVYLLIRFNEIIGYSSVLFIISLMTMLMSGLGACVEQDAKKIVALSTLSQLGVMMFSLSMGLWEMAFFHLLSHALFKSLLFMCMGMYIHGMANQQDLRGIGFQFNSMPVVSSYFLVSSFSLSGFPFLSGFYSKDSIVELFQFTWMGVVSYFLMMVCILSTVAYSMRLIMGLFAVEMNSSVLVLGVAEFSLSLFPMMALYLVSVIGGSLLFNSMVPVFFLGNALVWKILVIFMVIILVAGLIALTLRFSLSVWGCKLNLVSIGLGLMWFLGDFFGLTKSILKFSGDILRSVDQGWIELMGLQGLTTSFKRYSGGLDLGTEVGIGVYLFGGLFLVLVLIMA